MGKTVDACGLTCPAPVLLVKDAVEKGSQEITVLVDNEPSCENVRRFLTSRKYTVTDSREGEVFRIEARGDDQPKGHAEEITEQDPKGHQVSRIVVLVTTDRLGRGDDALGKKLMTAYLKTLKEMGPELWQLIFVNGGVKLTTGSSPVLEELQQYEKSGVIVLACGTCLEHFNLTAEKKVGSTTNMLDIVTATQIADKVVTIG